MYAAGRDELTCDMAETYGVFDMMALPVDLLATLASGLSGDSRIKRKLSGAKLPSEAMLLAAAVDRLSLIVWMQSEDGVKGRNRPKSILDAILDEGKQESFEEYDSPEAFMAARAKIMEG